jgi:uncharacterized membrane protein YfcA
VLTDYLITDPFFYGVAVPAVVLLGIAAYRRDFDAVLLKFLVPWGLLDWRNLGTALVLMPCVPLGVWSGVRIARRIEPKLFYQMVHLGMFLAGSKLLWDAWH